MCMSKKNKNKSDIHLNENSENSSNDLSSHEWCSSKAQINGSLMHITSIFGLTLSGLILSDLQGKEKKNLN